MADSEKMPTLYANNVEFGVGPFDLVLDFGFTAPGDVKPGRNPESVPVARIAMSLAHAKSMLPLMARLIAQYEQNIGPITAPGYDDHAKE